MINKQESYMELLKAIKKQKIDEKYKPKEYKFGLKSLNEKGMKKERIK